MQAMDVLTMSKHLGLLLVVLIPLSCQTSADDASSLDAGGTPRTSDLGELHGVSVDDSAWIGGYPTANDLDLARRRGIRTAIEVSAPDEAPDYDLSASCRSLGIEYVALHIESKRVIGDDSVDSVLAELRKRTREPLLFFCDDSSRAAMLFAIHRVVDDRLPLEQALVEARRAGMKPGQPELFVRAQVARLRPRS